MDKIIVSLNNFNDCVTTLNKVGQNLNNVMTVSQSVSKSLNGNWEGKSGSNFISNNNSLSKDMKKLSEGVIDIAKELKLIVDAYEEADRCISSKIRMD